MSEEVIPHFSHQGVAGRFAIRAMPTDNVPHPG